MKHIEQFGSIRLFMVAVVGFSVVLLPCCSEGASLQARGCVW
jgi:hypothetical protein